MAILSTLHFRPASVRPADAPARPDSVPAASARPASAASARLSGSLASRLNWLRAGVLGANDGIVSVAAVVVGVAAATTDIGPIITAGLAALVGGALSMAVGEYISVSSQSDSQRALIAKEREELRTSPDEELEELAGLYQARGLSPETAERVALELTAHDALAAHLSAELNIDESEVASPWAAAGSSAIAFVSGAEIGRAHV